jgi:hypothetical protein
VLNEDHWRDELFEFFTELVEIKIKDQTVSVPENNKLLRCFQFLNTDAISLGDYCWNGDCINCQIYYEAESDEIKSALACKMYVKQGLVITELSDNLNQDLAD